MFGLIGRLCPKVSGSTCDFFFLGFSFFFCFFVFILHFSFYSGPQFLAPSQVYGSWISVSYFGSCSLQRHPHRVQKQFSLRNGPLLLIHVPVCCFTSHTHKKKNTNEKRESIWKYERFNFGLKKNENKWIKRQMECICGYLDIESCFEWFEWIS